MLFIPENCPSCNSKLETVNEQLFCRNKECPAQLTKKLEHFCKTLGIKGLGPKTLEKLDLDDVLDIFYLEQADLEAVVGDKLSSKLFLEICKAKQYATLDVVLEAFAIPLLGSTASKKISAVVASIDEINNETCQKAGLGPVVTQNLLSWVEDEYKNIKDFLPFTFSNVPIKHESGKTVCITGKLSSFKTKADAEAALRNKGFVPTSSVTKNTDYLIDETSANSSKRQLAEKYGIKIITNLTNFLKEN